MFIHSWASHRFIKAVNFYLLIRGDVRRKTLSLDLSSASKIFTWQNILADQGFCGWAEGGWKGVALFMTKLLGNSSSGNLSSGNAAMKWRKSAPQSQGHLVTMGVTIQKNIFAHFILNQKWDPEDTKNADFSTQKIWYWDEIWEKYGGEKLVGPWPSPPSFPMSQGSLDRMIFGIAGTDPYIWRSPLSSAQHLGFPDNRRVISDILRYTSPLRFYPAV